MKTSKRVSSPRVAASSFSSSTSSPTTNHQQPTTAAAAARRQAGAKQSGVKPPHSKFSASPRRRVPASSFSSSSSSPTTNHQPPTTAVSPAGKKLLKIYARLYAAYGPRHWWPGDSPFEIALGAILTQNTAWRNVERAVANVKAAGALSAAALRAAPLSQLEALLRPSGYFRVKARRVRSFLDFLQTAGDGTVEGLRQYPTPVLRRMLLDVSGIGPETADSILLYALNRTVFVVDAYTRRVLSRHRLLRGGETYEETRAFLEGNLPRRRALYNEFHALFVCAGNRCCKPTPRCAECPLGKWRKKED